MEMNRTSTVYILSGPAGVGKSTTSGELVKTLPHSAYVSGDVISHMHKGGRKKPWESLDELRLIWDNILSLTRNFITYGNDVVVDYVVFPQEAAWLRENVKDLNARVVYAVLWADRETLLTRDEMRKPEHRMGERCFILLEQFMESGLDGNYLLNTSRQSTAELSAIVETVMNDPRFKMT